MHPIRERILRALRGSSVVTSLPPPRAQHRFAYGPDVCHFGDLWLPDRPGPFPVVAFIHGGFWRSRYGLEHAGFLCEALACSGLAAWSIEYRRLGDPGGGWPGTFLDVTRAIGHLRSLAPQYALDLERVVLMGHSAGGQLALWVAGARRLPSGHPLHVAQPLSSSLRAVVALAGVSDLRRAWELRLSQGVVGELLGGGPEQVPERYAAASPQELLPLGVPQILVHGTADDIVPLELSTRYHEVASALGDRVTFIPLPGMGHFEPIDPRSGAWPQLHAALTQALSR